jgi:hypothetical protein
MLVWIDKSSNAATLLLAAKTPSDQGSPVSQQMQEIAHHEVQDHTIA